MVNCCFQLRIQLHHLITSVIHWTWLWMIFYCFSELNSTPKKKRFVTSERMQKRVPEAPEQFSKVFSRCFETQAHWSHLSSPRSRLHRQGFFQMADSDMFAECGSSVNNHLIDQSPLSTDPRGICLTTTSMPHPLHLFPEPTPTHFLTHTLLCCFCGHFPLSLVPPIHPIQHHHNASLHRCRARWHTQVVPSFLRDTLGFSHSSQTSRQVIPFTFSKTPYQPWGLRAVPFPT